MTFLRTCALLISSRSAAGTSVNGLPPRKNTSARSMVRSYGNQSTYLRPGPTTRSRATLKDLMAILGTAEEFARTPIGGLTSRTRKSSSTNTSKAVNALRNRLSYTCSAVRLGSRSACASASTRLRVPSSLRIRATKDENSFSVGLGTAQFLNQELKSGSAGR
jgi:hypothetical protein